MERDVYPQSEDSPQLAIEPRRPSEPAPARLTLPEGAAHLCGHINVPGTCNLPVFRSARPRINGSPDWLPRAADKFDAQVAATARAEGRAVVTENVADFAAERDVVLVFVLKRNLPGGGGQAAALARILDRWTQDFPEPYLGRHWPRTG
jgi:hypothetical protein